MSVSLSALDWLTDCPQLSNSGLKLSGHVTLKTCWTVVKAAGALVKLNIILACSVFVMSVYEVKQRVELLYIRCFKFWPLFLLIIIIFIIYTNST